MINEHIPSYDEIAAVLNYTVSEKFHNFDQYCSSAFKAARENDLVKNVCTNMVYTTRTNPAFDRVLIGTWTSTSPLKLHFV